MGSLYRRFAGLVAELAKFGIVGGIGAVIDLGGAAYLHGRAGFGPLSAKAIALAVATVVSYLGNRYWTFRHRGGHTLLREWVVFFMLNVIGLVIAEATIGFTYYVLGYHGPVAYNLASFAGTGLGTVFRYFTYKRWVFIAPEAAAAMLAERMPELAVAGSAARGRSSSRGGYSRSGYSRSRPAYTRGYAGAHRRQPAVGNRR
jgi:putative flippase GtrA